MAALVLAVPLIADVPAGTQLEVRLLTPVSSYSSKPGNWLRAVVVAPVRLEGQIAIPAGAFLSGTVEAVRRVGLGLVHETARLQLDFTELELPDGRKCPVQTRLTAVDNARERVDKHGRIRGSRATDSISHRVGYRLAGFAGLTAGHPLGYGLLFALDRSLLKFPDPEIVYPGGTEMRLVLEDSLPIQAAQDHPDPARHSLSPESLAELQTLVSAMPYWSLSKRQQRAIDITNLLFIGSEAAIENAFTAAGWGGSRPMSVGSGLQVFRAIAADNGYADAPMRTLLVDGAESDMEWQKALNTFTKRHHLRLWKRPEQWHGETLWLAAATWDIATGFSFRYGLTHRVHRDADVERDKVVSDMVLTGCVDAVARIPRPDALRTAPGSHERNLRTDDAVAALILNSCEHPNRPRIAVPEPGKPGSVTRVVRRVTLTARNHFLRDNIVWRTSETAILGARAFHRWRQERLAKRQDPPPLPQQPREPARPIGFD